MKRRNMNTHTHTHERQSKHLLPSTSRRGAVLSLGDVVRGVVRGFDFGVFIRILGMSGVDDDHGCSLISPSHFKA